MPSFRRSHVVAVALVLSSSALGVLGACIGDDPDPPNSTNNPDGGNGTGDGATGGGDGANNETDGPTTGPGPITGNVLGNGSDIPIQDARVRIGDKVLATRGDGSFSFDGISTPYDIDVVSPNGEEAAIFRGLTSRSPRLRINIPIAAGTLTGKLTNYAFPLTNQRAVLFFSSGRDQSVRQFGVDEIQDGGDYSFEVQWHGGAKASGMSGAIIQDTSGGRVIGFSAYGIRGATANLDASTPGTNIPLGAVQPSGVAAATLTNHDLFAFVSMSAQLMTNEVPEGFPVASTNFIDSGMAIPSLTGAEIQLRVTGSTLVTFDQSSVVVRGLTAQNAANAVITLPIGAKPTTPPPNSTGVDTATSFAWDRSAATTPPTSTYQLTVECAPGPPRRQLTVYTTATSTKLPDLAAMVWSLPPNTPCQWRITTYPALTTIDAFVAPADAFLKGGPDRFVASGKSFTSK